MNTYRTAVNKLIIYTDGGSRGNPGSAAIGVVIQDADGRAIKSYGEAIGKATNNEAEYQAVIFALQKVKTLIGREKATKTALEIRMDSEFVARQLNGQNKIEEERLFPYFIKIWNLKMNYASVVFRSVPREKNREADSLVNQALTTQQQDLFRLGHE